MAVRNIKAQVTRLLREAGVTGPPVPVEQIARSLNAQIRHEPFSGDVSGALLRDERATIIGVNALHPETRQRFTIAHELGHLVFHTGHPVHFDRAPFRINLRNAASSVACDPEEIEANRFAAELLMPAWMLKRDLLEQEIAGVDVSDEYALETVKWLANRYQVSVQAMAIRLATLGFTVEV